MPTYCFVCRKCGKKFETTQRMNDSHTAIHCEQEADRDFAAEHTGIAVFESFWCDNLGPDPVWIESKAQLKAEAQKRGLEAVGI